MTGITHKQAGRYMRADLDGLLTAAQSRDLTAHLDECEACRLESKSFSSLTAQLKTDFRARWDTQHGPSQNVMANVQSQTRRIIMKKRIDFAFNLLGGAAALLVLFFVVTTVISQFQKKSTPATNETQVSAPAQQEPLIAFVMTQDYVNGEIYTMKPDGSGLTNITNNPATDESPAWSPDGKQIAFVSDRSGGRDIYIMNADGSNVRKLTDSPTFNDHFAWSPDGTKIAYLSSEFYEGPFSDSQIIVINADGSNKIALAERGSYSLLGWSPDGQNIVYKTPELGNKNPETRIMSASVDGTSTVDGPFFEGDSGRRYSQIYWETPEQFVALGSNYEQSTWGPWNITRFFTAGDSTNYNGSNPILATSNSPIVAVFNKTYVVEDQNSLTWFAYDGAPIPFAPWEFSKICKTPTHPLLEETTHIISPDKQQDLVRLQCPEGTTYFYLMNSDGTKIQQLGEALAKPLQATEMEWSSDGSHVLVTVASNKGTELYRFDIQEMLNDPTIQPIQLATDSVMIYGAVWQPIVNNDIVEENPTPEPTQTDNRLLAFTSNQDGNFEIYAMHADGSNLTNLTNNPAQDVSPVWSPDGKRIAFESDRNGFRQIFLMNADGTNVVQFTTEPASLSNPGPTPAVEETVIADQWIGEPYNLNLNLWSPDGKKLIFLEIVPGDEKRMLYIIDVNGENKKPLVNEAGNYSFPSWSPDGKHIAFLVLENDVTHIYSTDADGNNLTHVTEKMPSDETLYPVNYSWSRDGQSISFIASNWNQLLGGGGGGEGSPSYKWMAYEASLDGNTLVTNASTRSQIGGYWQGTYFLSGSAAMSSSPAFTWVHSDGTITMANPIEKCQNLFDSNTDGYTTGYSSYKQSSNGNVVIGGYCPNGDKWLFWANSKGTVKPLLNTSIHVEDNTSNAMDLWAPADYIWSQDDKYIVFNIISFGRTNMYIVNVADALKDPSVQPFQMTIGNGSLYYSPSWQPTISNDIVEEKPTPEPLTFSLTINEAETLAGFDVLEPAYVPAGYTLEGVAYDLQTQKVVMKYISQENNGLLFINQQRGVFIYDPATQAYVTPVPIGNVEAEYVQGAWIYDKPETTTPRWDPSATFYSLTWQKDALTYSIDFIGGETVMPLLLSEFVAIAESLK